MNKLYKLTCNLCGCEFDSKSARRLICYKDHYQKCPDCGTDVLWNKTDVFKGCKACNQKRAVIQRKATMLSRYGGETTLQSATLKKKVVSTLEDRYGKDNPMKVPEIQHKVQATNLRKYGAMNVMSNPDIAKKSAEARSINMEQTVEHIKEAWRTKYGVDNISKLPETMDKITNTFLQRYGVKRAVNVPEFRQKMLDTTELRHGAPYYVLTDEYRQSSHFRMSKLNQKFADLLDSIDVKYETEYRIELKCYDFYLPDANLLIEIDPTYTHNIVGNHWNKHGIPPEYHKLKTKLANDHGYQCMHIWDWDDVDVVLGQLKNKIKLNSSEFQVYRLTKDATDEFLIQNCIHGTCRGQLLSLGLVRDGQIYQIMTFGKSKRNKEYPIEMKRACTRIGYHIAGGYDKLSKAASQEFGIDSCVAYQDLSKISDIDYEALGMKLLKINPPRLFWSKGKRYISNYLVQNPNTEYTEKQLLADGWLPVYDCGQAVYVTQ